MTGFSAVSVAGFLSERKEALRGLAICVDCRDLVNVGRKQLVETAFAKCYRWDGELLL